MKKYRYSGVIVACILLISSAGCGEKSSTEKSSTETSSTETSSTETSSTEKKVSITDKASAPATTKGLSFTIAGPKFSEPQEFTVPNDSPALSISINESRILLKLKHGAEIYSKNGKHRLNGLILHTSKGAIGEFDDKEGVENAWFTFGINHGTDSSESATMDFDYSKGERQPVTIVIDAFEERARVSGSFTARVQRTNASSSDQFYDLQGTFDLSKN